MYSRRKEQRAQQEHQVRPVRQEWQDLKVRPELQGQQARQEHQVRPVHQERQDLKVRPELQGRRGGLVRPELEGRLVRLVRRELPDQREQTAAVSISGTRSIRARIMRSTMW